MKDIRLFRFKKINFNFVTWLVVVTVFGIVLIQCYWIYTAWQDREQEFSMAVTQSLHTVAQEIQERELSDYRFNYARLIDSLQRRENADYTDIYFFIDQDAPNNIVSYYTYGLLLEEYDIQPFFDSEFGQIGSQVEDYKGKSTALVINKSDVFNREYKFLSNIERYSNVEQVSDQFRESTFLEYANTRPLHKRLRVDELDYVLSREFYRKNIHTPYEFGIYDNGLATKIRSNLYAETLEGPRYAHPIFVDKNRNAQYQLIVSFPKKDEYVFSSIVGISSLSLLLSILIISLSSIVLIRLMRQKKISEMKTDFINNMTHEFKTPIATINLVLDSLNDPIVKSDQDRISNYMSVIREENSRMLTQVESVLKISQLERSKSGPEMKLVHLNSVIKQSVSHLSLIIENKKGVIKTVFKATNDTILGNVEFLKNMIINILDNAIKYTKADQVPVIGINTFNQEDRFHIEISDEGRGMTPNTQKLIYEKFYRVDTGNVHEIKGHGLGLTYVKKIADLHKAKLVVESKLGKGTTFSISFSNMVPSQD